MKRAGVRSAGNPHAAYDVAGVGNGVTGRIEAPADGESRRQTATPRPYSHRACSRPYLWGGRLGNHWLYPEPDRLQPALVPRSGFQAAP